jgi:molybdopterin molybdotransferase
VVPVEDTDFAAGAPGAAAPEWVSLARSVRVGENVRPRGQDARKGDPMLSTGQLLRAQDLGLLAMLGIGAVPVFRKPHVALFSSGDELLDVGAPLSPGMVRDTNTYTLGVLIEQSGAEFIRLGVAGDEYGAVESQLEKAVAANADLIISSAGVSVGALDFVKEVVAAHGTLDFWRVNMRPGKPLAFGAYRGIPFIGLPGNPVSAFVTFEVFARPAIGRLAGLPEAARERVRVRLAEEVRSDGRESYLRAEIREQEGELVARLTGHQGSGNLLALVRANALLIIPAGVECVPAKREVDAWLL